MCWHKWSKWVIYEWEGGILDRKTGLIHKMSEDRQRKVCDKCGLTKELKVET